MRKWCNSPEFVLTVIIFFLVTSLISSLSGCSTGPGDKLSKALQVVGGSGTLPPDALSNFNRFKAVFDANSTTSTEARLDYFSFAKTNAREDMLQYTFNTQKSSKIIEKEGIYIFTLISN